MKRKSYSNVSRLDKTAEKAKEYKFRFNEYFDGQWYISDEIFYDEVELPDLEEIEKIKDFNFTEDQKQFITNEKSKI